MRSRSKRKRSSADDRTTTYNLQILYADPPALAEEQTAPQIVEEALAAGLTLDITYEREEDYTVLLDGEELTATDDYTVAWASNTITLALKKEVVNGLEQGLHTFTLKTMAGSVEYKVFRKTAQDEWVNAGTMDDKAGGVASDGNPESVVKDGAGNTTVHMGMLSRVYYSEPIDLSETLYLELDINKLEKGSGHGDERRHAACNVRPRCDENPLIPPVRSYERRVPVPELCRRSSHAGKARIHQPERAAAVRLHDHRRRDDRYL